jgi:hypothetical protein
MSIKTANKRIALTAAAVTLGWASPAPSRPTPHSLIRRQPPAGSIRRDVCSGPGSGRPVCAHGGAHAGQAGPGPNCPGSGGSASAGGELPPSP